MSLVAMDSPTTKQASYLVSLMERCLAHDGTENTVAEAMRERGVTPEQAIAKISKKAASDLIGFYSNQSSVVKTEKADPVEGNHILEGRLFKVQKSSSDNLYAKELVSKPGEKTKWAYIGRQAPFHQLEESTLMTLEQAQEYGVRSGVCAVCGRELTVTKSIERGIGPVCATRF